MNTLPTVVIACLVCIIIYQASLAQDHIASLQYRLHMAKQEAAMWRQRAVKYADTIQRNIGEQQ